MANEFSNIDCAEVYDSYEEQMSANNWTASVTLQCAWSDRYNLVNDMFGNIWPDVPTSWNFPPRALDFRVKGFALPDAPLTDPTTQRYEYKEARVTVGFIISQQSSPGSAHEYFSEDIVPSADYARLPHTMFRWSSGRPLQPEEAPGERRSRETFRRTYFGLPTPIPAAYTDYQGSINQAAFSAPILGIVYPAGTIRYDSRVVNFGLNSAGAQSTKMTLLFTYRQEGYNRYRNFETGNYENIVRINDSGTNNDAFEYSLGRDFSNIA